jgi:hydroxypyruvate isomerase
MDRRSFLTGVAGAAGAVVAARAQVEFPPRPTPLPAAPPVQPKVRLKQGLMRVVFGQDSKLSFDDQCRAAADVGFKGFDLIAPQDWPTLKKYGLVPTMAGAGPVTFQDGLIHKEVHARLEPALYEYVDMCASSGVTSVISVGGQRRGLGEAEAADNAVAFLNRVKGHLESKGVTLCIENMNHKYTDASFGRTDQVFAHPHWGFDVCKRVNSPSVKVLFDIYHAQVMAGDLVATIRENFQWIGHFHTAGVPGRLDIDDTQEINYRFVAQAIANLGFTGYISHEFRPAPGHNPLDCIREAYRIIDV